MYKKALFLTLLLLTSLSFGTSKQNQNKKQKAPKQIYFKNCKEARAAGYSRMKRGEAGYREKLDRDGDGVACE